MYRIVLRNALGLPAIRFEDICRQTVKATLVPSVSVAHFTLLIRTIHKGFICFKVDLHPRAPPGKIYSEN